MRFLRKYAFLFPMVGLILGGTYVLAVTPKPTPKPPAPVCSNASVALAHSSPVRPYSLGRCRTVLGIPGSRIAETAVAVRECYLVEFAEIHGQTQILQSQPAPIGACK